MIDLIVHVLTTTPYLVESLGWVSALSIFISPILYNGDYKTATKSLIVVGGYASFVGMLMYFHLFTQYHDSRWIEPLTILTSVALAYCIGLFIGIFIHNLVKIRKRKYDKITK